MSISTRYRQLSDEIFNLKANFEGQAEVLRPVVKAAVAIDDLLEQVGEIPQVRLEAKLTPVLLKAHSYLDQARLTLEAAEDAVADDAEVDEGNDFVSTNSDLVWAVQQQIYRLLNDL